MTLLLAVSIVVVISCGLTWLLRRYALARSIMDIPNARSSHSIPTPRGGGVAIVLAFLAALLWMGNVGIIESAGLWALFGAGGFIALLGISR